MADHCWESRWGVMVGYEGPFEPDEDGFVRFSPQDRAPDYYAVTDVFGNDDDYEVTLTGKTAKRRAEALAAEFNRYEWQGPLDPEFADRRKRLKRLAPDFNRYWEGPTEARFPMRPERYLIHDWGVGWHPDDACWLVDTLDEVRDAIAEDEANVGRVVDLDTGEEVKFGRDVLVRFTP